MEARAKAPGTAGMAALVRLCLGFVGGWWLLQVALLGTGLIAIDRVHAQLANERIADLGAIAELARERPVAQPARPSEALATMHRGAAPDQTAERWRLRFKLVALALALPLGHLALALWLRRRVSAKRPLLWAIVNGATGMMTSLLLLGTLLTAGYGNAMVKAAAIDHSVAMLVERHEPGPDHHQFAAFQALDTRIASIAADGKSITIVRHWLPLETTPALMRGLKNVAVLIVATALLCAVFAGTAPGFKPPLAALVRPQGGTPATGEAALEAVRPLYFLAVFAENLCAPFLPRLLQETVAQAQLPPDAASALFMAYFFAFTAVLLPAGWLLGRFGPGGLIKGGGLMLAAGLALPALSLAAPAMTAARLLAGAGQGVVLVGVQSLILAHTNARRRTAGTSIIVFGFNGGMVGGNAFGSLWVERFGPQAVCAIAGLAAAIGAVLALVLIAGRVRGLPAEDRPGRRFDAGGLRCLLDPGFMITTLCIGIPTKAVLTGIVLFALPLILARRGFTLEEIGQIAMFYAAGVLLATSVVSRLSGRQRRTGQMLIVGALGSAVGMAALGIADHPWLASAVPDTVVLVGCILLLGMAHGCINAPVVAHVADLPIAHRLGPVRVATSYRLVERIGHIGGPLVVERCVALAGDRGALTWVAVAVAAAALVFLVHQARRRNPPLDR